MASSVISGPDFITRDYSLPTLTAAANSAKDVSMTVSVDGYEPIGIISITSPTSVFALVEYRVVPMKGVAVLTARNVTSASASGIYSIRVLFRKIA